MKIIVTGSLGYDYIMDFSGRFADRIMPDKIHSLSLSFLADKLQKHFGGTAGNIAYSLKLLGIDPVICSVAGNDFGPYRKFLLDHKIDISRILVDDKVITSSYFATTDADHNQIGTFFVGPSGRTSELPFLDLIKSVTVKNVKPLVILSPTDPDGMKRFVKICRAEKVDYLYDPAFQIATFTPEELNEGVMGARILIGNDYEITLIEEKLGISHEELIVSVPLIITTLGSRGSVIETRRDQIHVKPAKIKRAIDPTGAGDAYRSGFIAGFGRNFDLETCGRMGSIAAAYVVERNGTMTHDYSIQEFCERYQENYGLPLVIT
jgi:adenosine kinase